MDDEMVLYRGQLVEEMTRDELIQAVKFLGKAHRDALERSMATSRMYHLFSEIRHHGRS